MIKIDNKTKGKKNKLDKDNLLAWLLYNIAIIVINFVIKE